MSFSQLFQYVQLNRLKQLIEQGTFASEEEATEEQKKMARIAAERVWVKAPFICETVEWKGNNKVIMVKKSDNIPRIFIVDNSVKPVVTYIGKNWICTGKENVYITVIRYILIDDLREKKVFFLVETAKDILGGLFAEDDFELKKNQNA